MTCGTCRWWRPWVKREAGECMEVDAQVDGLKRFFMTVEGPDDFNPTVSLITGPEFGCVHHEVRT